MIWTTQQQLPATLRAVFQNTLRPELVAVLRESLPPLTSTLLANYETRQITCHEALLAKLAEHHGEISSHIAELKRQVSNPMLVRQDIESSISGGPKPLSRLDQPNITKNLVRGNKAQSSSHSVNSINANEAQESLQEV